MSENHHDQNEQEKDLLLDHNYDGIQELDHPLPSWWLAILYLSIIFSVIYVAGIYLGKIPTLDQSFAGHMQEVEALRAEEKKQNGFNLDQYNAFAATADFAKKGETVFTDYCVACHAEKGVGNIGPNLTDHYWIHAKGTPETIFNIVTNGVEEKGMPVWSEALTSEEIYAVTQYVMSLHGLNLKGKEAQGELIK